jgi:hypothetical protein
MTGTASQCDRRNRFAFATFEATETLIQAEADYEDQIRALPAELITAIARQMSSLVSKIQSGESNGFLCTRTPSSDKRLPHLTVQRV